MTSEDIFLNVMESLQPAEEMGGPSGEDYVALLDRISQELEFRRDNCIAIMAKDRISEIDKETSTLRNQIADRYAKIRTLDSEKRQLNMVIVA